MSLFGKKKSWILASTLALSMLVSCGESSDTSTTTNSGGNTASTGTASTSDEITITFWHYYGDYVQSQLKVIVDEFNSTVGAEKNIVVKTVPKSTIAQLEIEVTESAQGVVYADAMPDMFLAYSDKVLELHDLDVVADLSLYFTDEDLEKLIYDFVDGGYVRKIQSILPVVKSTELVFLNETLWEPFAEACDRDFDDLLTWEGIYDTAKEYFEYTDALTPDVEGDGAALFGLDSLQNYILVSCMQMGKNLFTVESKEREIVLDYLERAFALYVEGYSYGYFDSVGKFRTDDIRSTDIIAYAGSSASFAYFPDWVETKAGEKVDITWTALPYPTFEGGEPYVLSQGAGVVVTKQDGIREAACAEFLNFFLEYNIDFAVDSGYIPVVVDFLGDENDRFGLRQLEEKGMSDSIVGAYELMVAQIEDEILYQPEAFAGTYVVRTELATILEQAGDTTREVVQFKLAQGETLEQIQKEMDFSEQFDQIMSNLSARLESQNIEF